MQVLAQDECLRRYLWSARRAITPAKRSGTFVGNKGGAHESLRAYGIMLPKGGMILPLQEPEEIRRVMRTEKARRIHEVRRIVRSHAGFRMIGFSLCCELGGEEAKLSLVDTGGFYPNPYRIHNELLTERLPKLFEFAERARSVIELAKALGLQFGGAELREGLRCIFFRGGLHFYPRDEEGEFFKGIITSRKAGDAHLELLRAEALASGGCATAKWEFSHSEGYGTRDEAFGVYNLKIQVGTQKASQEEAEALVAEGVLKPFTIPPRPESA